MEVTERYLLVPVGSDVTVDAVYAAITGAGAQRLRRPERGYLVYPMGLTDEQLDTLRPIYPRHADYLRGEVWVWIGGGAVGVGRGVHGYDPKCGRSATAPIFFEPKELGEGQREQIGGLARRIEEELGKRGGLAELAAQA